MGGCIPTDEQTIEPNSQHAQTVALNGEYEKYKLVSKEQYNHNSYIFRFALQSKSMILGLPIGNHMMLKHEQKDEEYPLMRAYTPISSDAEKGYFELLVKIYSDGQMTQKLNALSIDDHIESKGPLGSIHYDAPSHFRITQGLDKYRELNVTHIGMLAGGTGITPMYQVMKHIDANRGTDQPQLSLIFCNRTEKDILLKSELDELAQRNENITVYYSLSQYNESDSDSSWSGGTSHINSDMIGKHIAAPQDSVAVMYCGPPGFNKSMKKILNQMGYAKDNILKF